MLVKVVYTTWTTSLTYVPWSAETGRETKAGRSMPDPEPRNCVHKVVCERGVVVFYSTLL